MSDTLSKIGADRMVAWDTYLSATKGLRGDLYVVTERREWVKLMGKEQGLKYRAKMVCEQLERSAA